MIQVVTFTGNSDNLQHACNQANRQANTVLSTYKVEEMNTRHIEQHILPIIVDQIVWYHVAVTCYLDCEEEDEILVAIAALNAVEVPNA